MDFSAEIRYVNHRIEMLEEVVEELKETIEELEERLDHIYLEFGGRINGCS